jgi:YNFM family putative membrane transporter
MLASGLLVIPSLGAAAAPTFGSLLVCRALQGACMPGLLTVGVPYVAEVYAPGMGGRAMGYYTIALVGGGTVGRVGVGLMTSVTGWRPAFAAVALLPLAGVILMRRRLPEAPVPERSGRTALATQLVNSAVLVPGLAAAALFFTFVGVFSYASFRLQEAPFGFSPAATSLVFALWVLGTIGPAAGRLADRVGWQRVSLGGLVVAASGVALTLPAWPATMLPGLAVLTLGMFAGVTGAQLGLAAAGPADRGIASAIYFSFYYGAGALAGFVPGLGWEAWGWRGVVAIVAPVLATGAAALLVMDRQRTRSASPAAPRYTTR